MASGWWDNSGAISGCVAAYQAIGAASQAASYSNRQSPGTYDAAPGVAPTWAAATGWAFDGATQYLTTGGLVPVNDQSWSMLVRFSGGTTGGGAGHALLGCYNTGPTRRWYYIPHYLDNKAYVSNGGQSARAPGIDGGVVGFAGPQPYRNGAADGAALPSDGAGGFGQIYIGAANDNSGALVALYCIATIQAVAIYNATLTAGQVATVSAAMAALVNNPSRPTMLQHHAAMLAGGR